MTLDEAEALAARVLAAIDALDDGDGWDQWTHAYPADRERVASDLAGLREHVPTLPSNFHRQGCAAHDDYGYVPVDWPCPDAIRYADNLRRTAALYGVTT